MFSTRLVGMRCKDDGENVVNILGVRSAPYPLDFATEFLSDTKDSHRCTADDPFDLVIAQKKSIPV